MCAFVTGSTGLLGNNLIRTLLQAGHEVWALARSEEKARRELGDTAARIVVGNIRNVAEFAYNLRGVDVVFHTAAYFREYYTPGDHFNAVELTNVEGTMELARAAQAMGVKKMIHTSSAGIIGLQPDGSRGDEQTPPWPGVQKNLYLKSKLRVEPMLRQFSEENGFFVASVLPSWMWGPHDVGPTPSGKLVLDAIAHELPPMLPPGGSAVVDARDVAAAMLRVAEIGRSGERYILSADFAELADIITNLAALTGARPPRRHIPFAAAEEALTISRTLSEAKPSLFRPLVLQTLSTTAGILRRAGRTEEALAASEETVALARSLLQTLSGAEPGKALEAILDILGHFVRLDELPPTSTQR